MLNKHINKANFKQTKQHFEGKKRFNVDFVEMLRAWLTKETFDVMLMIFKHSMLFQLLL